MIRAAATARDYVVYRHVAEREHYLAAYAHPFLTPEKRMLVRPIVGKFSKVRAAGDVGSVRNRPARERGSLRRPDGDFPRQPRLHQTVTPSETGLSQPIGVPAFRRRRQAVAQPANGSNTMSPGLDDARMMRSRQRERLLGWVAYSFFCLSGPRGEYLEPNLARPTMPGIMDKIASSKRGTSRSRLWASTIQSNRRLGTSHFDSWSSVFAGTVVAARKRFGRCRGMLSLV